jgi:hypothetical protein
MSKSKKTFTDPATGEAIESTALARWLAGLVRWMAGLVAWLVIWLVYGLINVLGGEAFSGPDIGLVPWLAVGLIVWLIVWLAVGVGAELDKVRSNPYAKWVHDGIARRQHLRRQRVLRQQEFPHVPDGALSLARPPGEPEPTAASLSLAEPPEEAAPRLAAGVEATETEEQVSTH